jgi:ATP-dependent Clp protease ATP-binding subunit ClpX
MFAKRLSCSFCGKSAADVAKLAAGPKVFICDVCAAEAHRIMSESGAEPAPAGSRATPNTWARLRAWLEGFGPLRRLMAPGG